MTKSNFLTGAVTFALLSSIIFVLMWDPGSEPNNKSAQVATPRAEQTATLKRFSLEEMVDTADRIFRGKVVSFQAGTVSAGGTELPTVTYKLRVDETLKGSFPSKGDVTYAEITMLGDVKQRAQSGDLQRIPAFPTASPLKVGSNYLLMITPNSSIGLTAPVGLGQGAFEISYRDNEVFANNEFNNSGIFDGPVKLRDLVEKIRKGGK